MNNLKAGDLVYFRKEWEDESDVNESNIPICSLAKVVARYKTKDAIFSIDDEDESQILLINTEHFGDVFVNDCERIIKFDSSNIHKRRIYE